MVYNEESCLKSLNNLLHMLSYHTPTRRCRYVHQRDHNRSALPFTLYNTCVAITGSRCVVLMAKQRAEATHITTLTKHSANLSSTRRGGQSRARLKRLNNEARNMYIREVTNSIR